MMTNDGVKTRELLGTVIIAAGVSSKLADVAVPFY